MTTHEQLTRGWRKLDKGEIIQAGDCWLSKWGDGHALFPVVSSIGYTCNCMDIYRRTDADLIAMLSRALMWIRTAGEIGFADEIQQLIQERT